MAVSVPPLEAEEVVRKFYEALSGGQMVDALDLFSTDATLTDEGGQESRGIRAIATSLLEYRKPRSVTLDRVESRGPEVLALYRIPRRGRYRGRFAVDRGRIRSVRVERVR